MDRFPAGSPSSLLMGLPRVDASRVGCQKKVKVPYPSGALQSCCRFVAHSDPSVPFERRVNGLSGRERFSDVSRKRKKAVRKIQKRKDGIFTVSVSAFMWDPVSSLFAKTLTSRQMLGSRKPCASASHSRRYANTEKCLGPAQTDCK